MFSHQLTGLSIVQLSWLSSHIKVWKPVHARKKQLYSVKDEKFDIGNEVCIPWKLYRWQLVFRVLCFVLLEGSLRSKQLFLSLLFLDFSSLRTQDSYCSQRFSHARLQASILSFIPSGWNIFVLTSTFCSLATFLKFLWNVNNLVRRSTLTSLLSGTFLSNSPTFSSLCCLIIHI